jgi:sec-independent protein translocase protein TatC
MWMLFRGKVASYAAMRNRWREMTIAVFAVAGVFTPISVLTMFLVAIPTMMAYGLGLAGLWVVTAGGRRDHAPPEERVVSDREGNAKWLALIVAVLVLVGVGVAVTGGISAVVGDDAFGSDGPADEPAAGEEIEDDPSGVDDADDDGDADDTDTTDDAGETEDADDAEEGADDETDEEGTDDEGGLFDSDDTGDADDADEEETDDGGGLFGAE